MRSMILLGAVASSLTLAACGSSGPTTSTGAGVGNPGASGDYTKALAYAACIRSHGVPNFPDPKHGGDGGMRIQANNGSMSVNGVAVNAPAFQAAQRACRSYLPNGGTGPQLSASRRNAMLQYSSCMRSHGLPGFPDPTFTGGGAQLMLSRSSGMDPNSPGFKSAQAACASVLPRTGIGG
jgi:hypothetical protein